MALQSFEQEQPIQGLIRGVIITHVLENTPGWRAGLMPGDVIVAVNHTPIGNLAELQKISVRSKIALFDPERVASWGSDFFL